MPRDGCTEKDAAEAPSLGGSRAEFAANPAGRTRFLTALARFRGFPRKPPAPIEPPGRQGRQGVRRGPAARNLGSFLVYDCFELHALPPRRPSGSRNRPAALQERERAMKSAVGRCLMAEDGQQLARPREHRIQTPGAVEELRLRPPGAPHPPGRLHHRLDEQLLPGVPGRQLGPQLRSQPQEILGVLVEHHRRPRGQPVPQSVPARCRLARGRPGPGAP